MYFRLCLPDERRGVEKQTRLDITRVHFHGTAHSARQMAADEGKDAAEDIYRDTFMYVPTLPWGDTYSSG